MNRQSGFYEMIVVLLEGNVQDAYFLHIDCLEPCKHCDCPSCTGALHEAYTHDAIYSVQAWSSPE